MLHSLLIFALGIVTGWLVPKLWIQFHIRARGALLFGWAARLVRSLLHTGDDAGTEEGSVELHCGEEDPRVAGAGMSPARSAADHHHLRALPPHVSSSVDLVVSAGPASGGARPHDARRGAATAAIERSQLVVSVGRHGSDRLRT